MVSSASARIRKPGANPSPIRIHGAGITITPALNQGFPRSQASTKMSRSYRGFSSLWTSPTDSSASTWAVAFTD